jgi:NADPH:quinone reductase
VPLTAPGVGQVLVKVGAAGVNPVETYIRAGAYAKLPSLPYTPGNDLAGTVIATGPNVESCKVGDRVYSSMCVTGSYSSHAICDSENLHPLPDRMSFAQGASLGVPYATAWHAIVNKANIKPGETILVHGASGGVGIAAVQIAKARGLTVIGTAGTEAGMELVKSLGAHHVFNHKEPGYEAAIMSATNGSGVNVVLEVLGNINLNRDLDMVGFQGRIVVVGNRGTIEIDPRKIMSKETMVTGMALMNVPKPEMKSIHRGICAGLENGSLSPVVAREFKLSEAPLAHDLVMQSGAMGKIVLIPEE